VSIGISLHLRSARSALPWDGGRKLTIKVQWCKFQVTGEYAVFE
jgi:hypothetical protein